MSPEFSQSINATTEETGNAQSEKTVSVTKSNPVIIAVENDFDQKEFLTDYESLYGKTKENINLVERAEIINVFKIVKKETAAAK